MGSLLQVRVVNVAMWGAFGWVKFVILFGLVGGTFQYESWDPKPDVSVEIWGEFGFIDSAMLGLWVGELMLKIAKMMDKIVVLRVVVSGDNFYFFSGYQMMMGIPYQFMNRESVLFKLFNDWFNIGVVVRALWDGFGKLFVAIILFEHIWNDGNFFWFGQDAGFLG